MVARGLAAAYLGGRDWGIHQGISRIWGVTACRVDREARVSSRREENDHCLRLRVSDVLMGMWWWWWW